MSDTQNPKPRYYEVTVDIVGRYLIRVKAHSPDEAEAAAKNDWDNSAADIIQTDESFDVMEVAEAVSEASKYSIAQLNDALRKNGGILDGLIVPGAMAWTQALSDLAVSDYEAICEKLREFDSFTPDNDPYGEHDFGSFEQEGVGKIFWKIDYYSDQSCQYGADAPEDPQASYRVITVMLAEEY